MINNYSVVIPLAGIGSRFKNAGYSEHKSILDISGASMLERIMEKFPCQPTFYIVTTKSILSTISDHINFISSKYNISIVIIEDHKNGPAFTLFKAIDHLPDSSVTFLSYTDITWSWEYDQFIEMYNSEASIACHIDFHPHIVKNNFSAFCKIDSTKSPSNPCINYLDEIREKSSFTCNWMNEYLSIGLFQFSSVSLIRDSLTSLIQSENRVAGEFFPSLLFNYLTPFYDVKLVTINSFVHYGDPISYIDFTDRAKFYSELSTINSIAEHSGTSYPSVVYASGSGSRMKSIECVEKADINLGNLTLLDSVYHFLPIDFLSSKIVYNNTQSISSNSFQKTSTFNILPTSSQLDSIYMSSSIFSTLENFFLCSCDCFANFDVDRFSVYVESSNFDVILFGFKPSLLQMKMSANTMSSFAFSGNVVDKISVKTFTDDPHTLGLCGFFFIRSGINFMQWVQSIKQQATDFNRELIVDDVFASLDLNKFNVGFFEVDRYVHLGTPEELMEYRYWSSSYSNLTSPFQ